MEGLGGLALDGSLVRSGPQPVRRPYERMQPVLKIVCPGSLPAGSSLADKKSVVQTTLLNPITRLYVRSGDQISCTYLHKSGHPENLVVFWTTAFQLNPRFSGHIPSVYDEDRKLHGIEAVIDKDLASELLARELDANLFIMATDADAVYVGWNTPEAKAIKSISPDALKQYDFPAGSMGPKVEAACRFAESTGKITATGALADLKGMVDGTAGTTVSTAQDETVWH